MTYAIQDFLNRNKKIIDKMKYRPIVEHWLQSRDMTDSLSVMDKHIEYLLNNGGRRKIEEWLLENDEKFNAITAERYILAYLKKKNANITDNLKPNGIDGFLENKDGHIGIEVTTLNGAISNWIFTERLKEHLDSNRYWSKVDGLEVEYSLTRIVQALQGKHLYEYIVQTGEAIVSNNNQALTDLKISINRLENIPCISFNVKDQDSFSWFKHLTHDVENNLNRYEKRKQLARQVRNIVFVGINHTSPSNGIFPRLFGYLTAENREYKSEIEGLEAFWASSMSRLKNVIGICYFFYSLPSELPFYPLKIFWRSDGDIIDINL